MAPIDMPETVGPYQLEGRLGTGGMGEVYRGFDSRLDRPVALKHIRADVASSNARERFRREAKAIARLSHPTIVLVHDWVETEEGGWIVMELVEGESLAAILKKGPLPLDQAVSYTRSILEGLAAAHASGIVHRDLKAENIMITAGKQVKILDFGLAKRLQPEDNEPALTVVGKLMGTVSAMSPEQALGTPLDQRSDLFSLGSLLYEMLTGASPFHSDNKIQTLTRICTLKHKPATDLRPTLPEPFSELLDQLLEKEPEDRPQSAFEVISALDRLPLSEDEASAAVSAPQDSDVPPPSSSTRPPSMATGETENYSTPSTYHTDPGHVTNPSASGTQDHTSPGDSYSSFHDSADDIPLVATPGRRALGGRGASGQTLFRNSSPDIDASGPPVEVTFLREANGGDRVLELQNRRNSLLSLALDNDITLYNECGGRARCSTCRIRVTSGLENVRPRPAQEAKLAQSMGWDENIRLACQTRVDGPVEVERLVRDTQDIGFLLGEQTQTVPAQELPLALMSCELLDFDTFVDKAPPYDQMHLLQRFLSQIGDLVLSYGGKIQSYSGTGFRALFGLSGGSANEKCLAAVRAGLRAVDRMVVFNRYSQNYFSCEFTLGIGLHFARMVVGQYGYPSNRPLLTIGEAAPLVDAVGQHNAMTGTAILATEDLINIVEDDLTIGEILPDEILGTRTASLYEVYDLADPDPAFIVQTTFERLSAYSAESAAAFYNNLFQLDRRVRGLFPNPNDMVSQGQKFMSMLTTAVGASDRLHEYLPEIRALGARHVDYGVQPAHYETVREALLMTVEQMTGGQLDAEVRRAWEHFYDQVVEVMLEEN